MMEARLGHPVSLSVNMGIDIRSFRIGYECGEDERRKTANTFFTFLSESGGRIPLLFKQRGTCSRLIMKSAR